MDEYIQLAEDIVQDGSHVVFGKLETDYPLPTAIYLDVNLLYSCPEPKEFNENLNKRLAHPSATAQPVDLRIVACMCLATNDYSVNHMSIRGVSPKCMVKVWSHIERQTVSASTTLRDWTKKCLGTRTCEGYVTALNVPRSVGKYICNDFITKGSWSHCIDVTGNTGDRQDFAPATILSSAYCDVLTSTQIKYYCNV